MTRVFVFDPGLTTGVVMAEIELRRGKAEIDTLNEIRATMELFHIKAPVEVLIPMRIWECLCDFEPDVVVGEDFRLFRVDSSDHVGLIADRILSQIDLLFHLSTEGALEYGPRLPDGFVEGEWTKFEMPEYTKQMPGERSVVTDDFLRRNDLWRTPRHIEGAVTGDSNHAMDALRHLIVWTRKMGKTL